MGIIWNIKFGGVIKTKDPDFVLKFRWNMRSTLKTSIYDTRIYQLRCFFLRWDHFFLAAIRCAIAASGSRRNRLLADSRGFLAEREMRRAKWNLGDERETRLGMKHGTEICRDLYAPNISQPLLLLPPPVSLHSLFSSIFRAFVGISVTGELT